MWFPPQGQQHRHPFQRLRTDGRAGGHKKTLPVSLVPVEVSAAKVLPGHAQCGGDCGFCHPKLNLPWFPPRNHRSRCYPEIFPFCCIVSGQSGWGVRGPLKPLYPSPTGGTMCPGLRGRQRGLAAVTGLGSQGHTHLCCGQAGRSLLAANPAPTAHLSPQGKAAKAAGPRPAGEHSGLAACLLSSGCSPHFLLVKLPGETIWGTGSPDCVVITQKWLLFSAIFKFMFQLCHFLCVTLALPGLSCHL